MRKKLAKIIATSFGFGYVPVAPGTFGALFALGISCLMIYLGMNPQEIFLIHTILIFLGYTLGVWATSVLENEWGHDPSKIVMDESIGTWITYLFITPNYYHYILGFILFRIFDIWKPIGVKYFDSKNTASSVMLDDVIAGIYAAIVLFLILKFFPF